MYKYMQHYSKIQCTRHQPQMMTFEYTRVSHYSTSYAVLTSVLNLQQGAKIVDRYKV